MDFHGIIKNRMVLGISCIVLSLIICFGLTPLFNGALKAQTEIIRVTKDIRKGEAITEDKIEKVKVGAYNLPNNIVKTTAEIKNMYAACDFMKGDYILNSKITNDPYKEDGYLYKLDGTKKAISVSIKSLALGLSGKLQSGDIVSIIASDYGDRRETLIPPELQYVEVLAVTTAKGVDESTQAAEKTNEEEKQLPSTVTLLVNTTQAKILADLEAKSKIHLALSYRGDENNTKKFLDAQDDSIKKQEAGTPENIPQSTPASVQVPLQGGQKNAQ